jgi:hypothetical protein
MTKIFTGKTQLLRLSLIAFITIITAMQVNGQILWGAGSTDAASDEAGRFAKEFGTENAWKVIYAIDLTDTGEYWTRTTTGISLGRWWGTNKVFQSPSLADGAALFDSDYMDVKELMAPHRGELQSPDIDLTGLTAGDVIDAKVFVYYRSFEINEFSLGFSGDGGKTWKDYSFLDQVGNAVNEVFGQKYVTLRLKGATAGVTDFSKCKLRLKFDGDGYFAMVDNISLQKGIKYDITFPSGSQYDYNSTICPSPYAQIPLRNLLKAGDWDFLYGAVVYNNGDETIPASANPKLTCELLKSSDGSWTSLHKKIIAISRNIPAGDTVETNGDLSAEFKEIFKTNGTGNYRFTYHLSHDLADRSADNDDKFHDFTVTEDYSWFSAAPTDETGYPAANTSAFPVAGSGQVIQSLEQGVYFYFPDQTDLAINSVRYNAYIPSNTEPNDYALQVKIYSIEDISKPAEAQLAAIGIDAVTAIGGNTGKYVNREVNIVSVATSKKGYKLNNRSGIFAISLAQQNIDGLISINGVNRALRPGGYKTNNGLGKELSYFYQMLLIVGSGQPGQGGTVSYYGSYNGEPFSPSIAAKIVNASSVEPMGFSQNTLNENNVTQYPNPVTDRLNLQVRLEEMSAETAFILTDINGMILHMENYKDVKNMEYSFNTGHLLPGSYVMHIRTDKGNIAKKFIKY